MDENRLKALGVDLDTGGPSLAAARPKRWWRPSARRATGVLTSDHLSIAIAGFLDAGRLRGLLSPG